MALSAGWDYKRRALRKEDPKLYNKIVDHLLAGEWTYRIISSQTGVHVRVVGMIKQRMDAEKRACKLLEIPWDPKNPPPQELFESVTLGARGRRIRPAMLKDINPIALEKYKLALAAQAKHSREVAARSLGFRTKKNRKGEVEVELPKGVSLEQPETVEDYVAEDLTPGLKATGRQSKRQEDETKAASGLLKKLETSLPAEEQVRILTELARDEEPTVRLRAMSLIKDLRKQLSHDLRESDPDRLPGPLFVIPRLKTPDGRAIDPLPGFAPVTPLDIDAMDQPSQRSEDGPVEVDAAVGSMPGQEDGRRARGPVEP